mmetsp:Transcript_76011/g.163127  ORF Transcript_76011/g.163127 Transcript_76011/m.163127 type:complete len:166 (-) Transcript_76011:59-556(-)
MQAEWSLLAAPLLAALFIALCGAAVYALGLYRLLPGWGPIRKFDASGNEDMRINQLLIHRHAAAEAAAAADGQAGGPRKGANPDYGSASGVPVAQAPWGHCEAPWQRRELFWHPQLGDVAVRHGFSDTQYLRAHSEWWARDEPHYLAAAGISRAPERLSGDMGSV